MNRFSRLAGLLALLLFFVLITTVFAAPVRTEPLPGASGLSMKALTGSDITSHINAEITTNKTTYNSGETAIVSVKYDIDQGSAAPGDYFIVQLPEDIVSGARFSFSPQHFSAMEDLGGGRYALVLGEDAASSLSGSMSIYVTTDSQTESSGTINVDNASATITVVPSGGGAAGTVVGYETEAIMKDGRDNGTLVGYGDYDYSEGYGNLAIQIGIIDSSTDLRLKYRLFANRKNQTLSNVIVTDTLPDGMEFAGDESMVVCYLIDASTMARTNTVITPKSVSITGQTMTVNLGDIDYPVEIDYYVLVPAQDAPRLRNHSEIAYMQDGTNYLEHRDYILQSSKYSAVNGIKSADKSEISEDPTDQFVTYTLTFWNDADFAIGAINLNDQLDSYIDFLYADDNPYFTVTQDPSDDHLLHITNTSVVPGRTTVAVTFVCDFSRVPVGYTVKNTTGGNTTKTTKVGGSVAFEALKTVDGETPDETFTLQLRDSNGIVLQTRNSDSEGKVQFDKIAYTKEDLGKTYYYTVTEKIPETDDSYVYDETIYMITVTVGSQADENGVIPVSYSINKDGEDVNSMTFDNQVKTEEPTGTPITPTVVETTLTPTLEATTLTPTVEVTTVTPTVEATTLTPTVEATTITPTVEATTLTPTVEATTVTPSVGATTITPTSEGGDGSETATPFYGGTGTPAVTGTATPFMVYTMTPNAPVMPRTGFSARHPEALAEKPMSLNYQPMRMTLEIPSLSLITEIVEVPEIDGEYQVTWLGDSVGSLEGYAAPGEGRAILTGHNHLNTTEAGPFVMLHSLQVGDRIFILNEDGSLNIYSVYANLKISETDFASLDQIMNVTADSLTLMTCEDERESGGYANRRIIAAAPL